MKAIVMAGGEGTRLRPITERLPKPFVRVAGKPTIEYVLDRLVEAGFRDVIVTTYYKPHLLIERLAGGTKVGARVFYSVEDTPAGTAGGVKKVGALLDSTFVVTSGDVLADVDIGDLVKAHKAKGAMATMALTRVEDPTQFGIVGLDGNDRIVRFAEKPKREDVFSNLINAGIYVLEPEVLSMIPAEGAFDFSKQLFPRMLAEGKPLYGREIKGFWMDVGRPADLIAASAELGKRHHGGPFKDKAEVDRTAKVVATDLYAGAKVARDAQVEGSILYDGASVGPGARVARSILCDGAIVEEGAVVEDAVLGAQSRVPAKTRYVGGRLEGGAVAKP
ncbi:MAG TPA: NDP-sugar synthase [Candidatus Thermoplasmatota archaeon]|nr:NDP-sugar synthase [Candidatus Thermoplasmatota archaeon]